MFADCSVLASVSLQYFCLISG